MTTAGRLQDHSQLVRAVVDLPKMPVEGNYVDTGACYGGGWTQIDVAQDGVVSVGHHWLAALVTPGEHLSAGSESGR
ncbi:hypothetical protein [Streptomyces sp. HUAS TT7]|uniref:hypothetical protein n=1 Tax=Streptomyces sp. HUAS TT7 TaxID=3447507 RepID=UPI003F65A46B